MDARAKMGVIRRKDVFGGICYVPHRDDFFALDKAAYELVCSIAREWTSVASNLEKGIAALARLGICETRTPTVREVSYSGPSFIGDFQEIATVSEPLVVNCFATSFCPLKCVYCHADDLMQSFRKTERPTDIENVAATASLIPAMVAVITGGDPLTRPQQAFRLIERLSMQKAIVLDTSGVGDIESLMPAIKSHNVHVRVSIDAISEVNDKVRPINAKIAGKQYGALRGATSTVQRCLAEAIPVTVQTVVTTHNSGYEELRDLRDWLAGNGVRHWVLHVCVEGGSARRVESLARKQDRPRPLLPDQGVYKTIKRLIDDTRGKAIHLDIRCTDTGNTPNSVLLIGSNGDLYTEGLAHKGKVRLFSAGEARPDLIKALWSYVDHFGHARRYLNWNPWFYESQSFEDLVYKFPLKAEKQSGNNVVETEAKFHVQDSVALEKVLAQHAELVAGVSLQRDEYFDTPELALNSNDFVVRLRFVNDQFDMCLKGPRFRTPSGEYSRVELEFPPRSEADARNAVSAQGLIRTWVFEKRRTEYKWKASDVTVVVDEIPEIGGFLEIEGELSEIKAVASVLSHTLGEQESRNYKEIFVAYKGSQGIAESEVHGAQFEAG